MVSHGYRVTMPNSNYQLTNVHWLGGNRKNKADYAPLALENCKAFSGAHSTE